MARFEDGWHVWDTTELAEPSAMEATSWFRDTGRQGRRLREMLRSSIRLGAWQLEPHGRRLRISADPSAANELSPRDAFRLADRPLVLLVENRESDGAFLKRIIEEIDPALHAHWRKAGDSIRVDSVGGSGGMPQEVRRQAGQAAGGRRLVAIIDSDRKGPADDPSRPARNLLGACAEHGVPCWVLAKREAENYLPRVLLDALPDARPGHTQRVAAWDRLSEVQKDFFDVRRGLSSGKSAAEEALFQGIPAEDCAILSGGFGGRAHCCWSLCEIEVGDELAVRSRRDLERGIDLIRSQV